MRPLILSVTGLGLLTGSYVNHTAAFVLVVMLLVMLGCVVLEHRNVQRQLAGHKAEVADLKSKLAGERARGNNLKQQLRGP